MDANFLETNPAPVKAALALHGPDPERAPAAARAGQRQQPCWPSARALRQPGSRLLKDQVCLSGGAASRDRALRHRRAGGRRSQGLALVSIAQGRAQRGAVRAAERGPDGTLARQRVGQGRHSARLPARPDQPAATGGPFPFYDKDTYPSAPHRSRGRHPHRSRGARPSGTAATSRRA